MPITCTAARLSLATLLVMAMQSEVRADVTSCTRIADLVQAGALGDGSFDMFEALASRSFGDLEEETWDVYRYDQFIALRPTLGLLAAANRLWPEGERGEGDYELAYQLDNDTAVLKLPAAGHGGCGGLAFFARQSGEARDFAPANGMLDGACAPPVVWIGRISGVPAVVAVDEAEDRTNVQFRVFPWIGDDWAAPCHVAARFEKAFSRADLYSQCGARGDCALADLAFDIGQRLARSTSGGDDDSVRHLLGLGDKTPHFDTLANTHVTWPIAPPIEPYRYAAVPWAGETALVAFAVDRAARYYAYTGVWVVAGSALKLLGSFEFNFVRGKVMSVEVGAGAR